MSGNADEKVIGLGRSFTSPSPADILANPKAYLQSEQAVKPERFLRERAAPTPLGQADPAPAGSESYDPESDYKACGWAGNKTLPTLRLILKDGSEIAIVYGHLDTNPVNGSSFVPKPPGRKGNLIFLRAVGFDGVFMVVIEGIRLRRIWELIMSHQTPWICELPDGMDFASNDEPVIWSITAKGPLKPER